MTKLIFSSTGNSDRLEKITTEQLINGSTRVEGLFETSGFYELGDGGGASWLRTLAIVTPSQSPSQLGDKKLSDADGYQWDLIENGTVSLKQLGGMDGSDNTLEVLASAQGGSVLIDTSDDDTASSASVTTTFEKNKESPLLQTHTQSSSGTAKTVIQSRFKGGRSGEQVSLHHIRGESIGSGENGPTNADYGTTIAMHKLDYGGTSPLAGEMDGLSIFVRQDGPKGQAAGSIGSSDASGVLVNMQNVDDCGFTSAWEASTSNYNTITTQIDYSIQTQIGAIDANRAGKPTYGYVAASTTGSNTFAYYSRGDWEYLIYQDSGFYIKINGDLAARSAEWVNGAWYLTRGAGVNGATQLTHRGDGAFLFLAQDSGEVQFGTGGAVRFRLDSNGNIIPALASTYNIGNPSSKILKVHSESLEIGAGVTISSGSGTPEGAVAAVIGSMYTRTDGGAGTTLYIKESGVSNTGWVAK